ncbi:MAG: serine hydrolase [Flavisolibacter sp.]
MKSKIPVIFSAILILCLFGCRPVKQALTPSLELKKYPSKAQEEDFIRQLLSRYPEYFDTLLQHNDKYHIKIIYTRIDRDKGNRPRFTHYYFNVDPAQYFYPASTVKMPTAFLALQKLHELKRPGLDKETTMITEAAYPGQTPVYNDPSSADGRPSIAQYIKRIFLVSDNEAFNRLYEFLGQEYLNDRLHRMGYDSAQILHRLDISMTEDQYRHTNPVKFYDPASHLVFEQPLTESRMTYQPRNSFMGKGFYSGGQLVNRPFDFSRKNRLSLVDLHSILMSVLFPASLPKKQRFGLSEEDYRFVYTYMSMKPRESLFPQYDTSYTDAYSKLLLYGGRGNLPEEGLRIFNKEGDAYGFLTDVAYIVDFRNHVEFLLSANIYCNQDEVFNDDHYDYESVGYPFMKNLGRVFYEYELQRKRPRIPDLSRFKLNYHP